MINVNSACLHGINSYRGYNTSDSELCSVLGWLSSASTPGDEASVEAAHNLKSMTSCDRRRGESVTTNSDNLCSRTLTWHPGTR